MQASRMIEGSRKKQADFVNSGEPAILGKDEILGLHAKLENKPYNP